jgi:hypothetical protein
LNAFWRAKLKNDENFKNKPKKKSVEAHREQDGILKKKKISVFLFVKRPVSQWCDGVAASRKENINNKGL